MVQKLKAVFDKCVMKVAMVRKGTESNKQVLFKVHARPLILLIRWQLFAC